jgi:hypothetical protein
VLICGAVAFFVGARFFILLVQVQMCIGTIFTGGAADYLLGVWLFFADWGSIPLCLGLVCP